MYGTAHEVFMWCIHNDIITKSLPVNKYTMQWRIQAVSALPGNPPSRTKGVGPGTP